MLISVAMATYNGARFLEPQLASIAMQTRLPAELVVSDDGSTDHTLAIVRAFAKTASFEVRVLEKVRRLGVADNFLHAALNCQHELVAFSEQDDVWLPEKLDTAFCRIINNGSLLAMHTLTETDGRLKPIATRNQQIDGDGVAEPLTRLPYRLGCGNSMLFRRNLLQLISPMKRPRQPEEAGPLAHDQWTYILADGLGRVSSIAAPLILHRQRGMNVSGIERRGLRAHVMNRWIKAVVYQRERFIFYSRISDLFAEIARTSQEFRATATAAANEYATMAAALRYRVETFDGSSFSQRFDAYRHIRNLGPSSRMNYLCFGVSGLHRFAEGYEPEPAPLNEQDISAIAHAARYDSWPPAGPAG